jgi:hypothetical protein
MALIEGRSRKELRDDTVARIIAAGTAAGSRVYPAQSVGFGDDELPAIALYVDSETMTRLTQARPPEFARMQVVKILISASAATDSTADDACDALIDEVISATVGDRAWGETNGITMIDGMTVMKGISGEGERAIYGATLQIQIQAGYGTYDDG